MLLRHLRHVKCTVICDCERVSFVNGVTVRPFLLATGINGAHLLRFALVCRRGEILPLEKWQLEYFACRSPFLCAYLEHELDSLHGIFAYSLDDFIKIFLRILVEGELALFSKLVAFSPLIFLWGTQYPEDLVDLINFRCAWEQRPLHVELSHDAASSKDI